jgi:hypothetical protein
MKIAKGREASLLGDDRLPGFPLSAEKSDHVSRCEALLEFVRRDSRLLNKAIRDRNEELDIRTATLVSRGSKKVSVVIGLPTAELARALGLFALPSVGLSVELAKDDPETRRIVERFSALRHARELAPKVLDRVQSVEETAVPSDGSTKEAIDLLEIVAAQLRLGGAA